MRLANGSSYALKASVPRPEISSSSPPPHLHTSLETYHSLLAKLASNTSLPHPVSHKLDATLALVPFVYLILSSPSGLPLSMLRSEGRLSERQDMVIDLQIGRWMKEVHENVQNDWFGAPKSNTGVASAPPSFFSIPGFSLDEECYSWQEAFTSHLESVLHALDATGTVSDVPFADLRRYLGRAIGSFLFDDCEVPSLVSFTADTDSIFIELPDAPDADPSITSMLPPMHAIWGDPLLETLFIDPSQALLEGYGGSPIVFARQRTKRLWYTAFLAGTVLLQSADGSSGVGRDDKVAWAHSQLRQCAEKLKDAPCY